MFQVCQVNTSSCFGCEVLHALKVLKTAQYTLAVAMLVLQAADVPATYALYMTPLHQEAVLARKQPNWRPRVLRLSRHVHT